MRKLTKLVMIVLVLSLVLASCFALVGCGEVENVKVIEIKLTDEDYAFAVNKEDSKLLEDVNKILAEIKADGTLEGILDKYFKGEKVEGITSAKKDASKDQLVVATNAAFPPFEYTIGDKYAGVDMEIAKVLADRLGKELVIDNMEFDSVVLSVNSGKSDIGMAGLTVTEKRKESVDFTETYFNASQMVIVRESDTTFDNCKTVEDVENILKGMKNKKAGYQNGTTGNFYVTGNTDFGFEGFKNLTAKGFQNGALAVKKLQTGGIDLVIIDEMPAKSIVASMNK